MGRHELALWTVGLARLVHWFGPAGSTVWYGMAGQIRWEVLNEKGLMTETGHLICAIPAAVPVAPEQFEEGAAPRF